MTERKDNGKEREQEPEKQADILDFELYDAVGAGETWAVLYVEDVGRAPGKYILLN